MGAYLYYKTESNPDEVNDYLETSNLQKKLSGLEEQGIFIVDEHHLQWVKENRPDLLDWEAQKFGTGDLKTSSGISFKADEAGLEYENIAEMWVQIFEALNKRFKMKYYANSCSLCPDNSYFTLEQMKRITDNGKLLSGKSSSKEHVVELYNKYFALFSQPKAEAFEMSLVKEKDEIKIEGEWYKVVEHWKGLCIQKGYNTIPIKDIEVIQGFKKHVPKIRYNGAIADMEAYILDKGTLLYVECIGQEMMVKSVTSVLMQGRLQMNNHTVDASFGYFSINKAGNRRKILSLEDGVAHAILYHSPSIQDTKFSVLIGRDKKEIMASFSTWMEKSQPLPYPKELTDQIFASLQNKGRLIELTTFNIEAVKLDLSILEDEYHDLQEIVLEVCKINGLIAPNAKPLKQKAPLPKSPLLAETQVQKIYDTLEKMPKTYSLDDVAIKPVGLKLFNHNMTAYIVEADGGSDDDAFAGLQSQCFGYVENLSAPECSEWGYVNVEEYIGLGFEMDLYFEDMYIDSYGRVGILENLKLG